MSVKPPNKPWEELKPKGGGYLSIFYSDDLSGLPVRWITKPGDNKSDPNLETMSYGMFSTCSRAMRSGLVKRKLEHLFFAARRNGKRCLVGYYHIKWYAAWPHGVSDFCIAADRVHFLEDPIPLEFVAKQCNCKVDIRFRLMKLLTEQESQCLLGLINKKPDATQKYLEEIDRLERFNLLHSGFRYVAWRRKQKFSWNEAGQYLKPRSVKTGINVIKNSSVTNKWKCVACGYTLVNKALLKKCPNCNELGTLEPN